MSDASEWQRTFARALVMSGVNAKELDEDGNRNFQLNYTLGSSRVAFALVKNKIALAFTGDETEELEEDGWAILRFDVRDMDAFHRVMSNIFNVRREMRKSEMTTPKQTSKAEDLLLNVIVADPFNLPIPQRDYTFKNEETGKEITVPDFAWKKYKVCVYVDGGWWHHGKDVLQDLNMDKSEKREIVQRVTKRNEKDANSRRFIEARLGWRAIECSAERLIKDEEYLQSVAEDIKSIYMDARHRVIAEEKYGTADAGLDII